jgi:hypothetical protein
MSSAKIPHRRPVRTGNNSTVGEKTAARVHAGISRIFGGRGVLNLVVVIVGLVIIVGGLFWFKKVYEDPSHVFWGMINNNLSTYSVTKETTQSTAGNTSKDFTQIGVTPKPAVHDVKDVTASANGATSRIKVESIGTPKDVYQRYVLIDQPAQNGKSKPDYSAVYNMWLKNGGNGQSGNTQLFNNAVFSAFLFGNLPQQQRSDAMAYFKKAYIVNFNDVKKQNSHMHKTYTYTVTLNLRNYAQGARYYAAALNLPNASQINPDNYKATDKLVLNVNVDVLSRQLKEVVYKSSGATENYSAYGILPTFKVPAHTVSYSALQQAVTKASSQ